MPHPKRQHPTRRFTHDPCGTLPDLISQLAQRCEARADEFPYLSPSAIQYRQAAYLLRLAHGFTLWAESEKP